MIIIVGENTSNLKRKSIPICSENVRYYKIFIVCLFFSPELLVIVWATWTILVKVYVLISPLFSSLHCHSSYYLVCLFLSSLAFLNLLCFFSLFLCFLTILFVMFSWMSFAPRLAVFATNFVMCSYGTFVTSRIA